MDNKSIILDAPEGATHVTGCGAYLTTCKESGEYLFRRADDYEWQCFGLGYTVDDLTRSLADIRRIVELEQVAIAAIRELDDVNHYARCYCGDPHCRSCKDYHHVNRVIVALKQRLKGRGIMSDLIKLKLRESMSHAQMDAEFEAVGERLKELEQAEKDLIAAKERIKELEQERIELLSVVYNYCVGDVAMGYRIDAESLGQDIYSITGLNAEQVHQLRKQAEDL